MWRGDRGAPGRGRHGIAVIWGWCPSYSLRPSRHRPGPRRPSLMSSTQLGNSVESGGSNPKSGGDRSSGYSSSAGWSQIVSGGGGRAGDSGPRPAARAACFPWYPAAAQAAIRAACSVPYILPQGLVAINVFGLGSVVGDRPKVVRAFFWVLAGCAGKLQRHRCGSSRLRFQLRLITPSPPRMYFWA